MIGSGLSREGAPWRIQVVLGVGFSMKLVAAVVCLISGAYM